MKYEPSDTIPEDPKDLGAWLIDEFRRISNAVNESAPDSVLFKEWNESPSKVYEGLVVFADGTNWNPGSGKGIYGYYGAAWVKL